MSRFDPDRLDRLRVSLVSFGLGGPLTLASGYLKAYAMSDPLLSKRATISIESSKLDEETRDVLWKIKEWKPHMVGFSCYVWSVGKILTVCDALRQILPEVIIVLGGPEVSPRAEEVMAENPSVDIIAKGEGEATFKEIMYHYLVGNPSLSDILGIVYRAKGRVVSNEERPQIEDIDTIPSPYLDGAISFDDESHLYIQTQRGCIFKCRYCYYHEGYRNVRYFSMERVKQELLLMLRSGAKIITFVDATFNADKERMKEICEFISQSNSDNVAFHAEVRAEFVDEETADSLSKANFVYLEVGLQSRNRKALQNLNRKTDLAKFKKGVSLLLDKGIKEVELQLIIGLPGDNLSSFLESLQFVLSLEPPLHSAFTLMLLPGTYLYQHRDKFRMKFHKQPPYYVLSNETFPFEEIMEAEMMANSLYVFTRFYKKTSSFLTKELGTDIFDLYKRWRTWMKDDAALLRKSYILNQGAQERFPRFVEDICNENSIDYEFYGGLLEIERSAVSRFKT